MAKPNPGKLRDEATKYLTKGKLDKALQAYEELEKVSPDDLKVPQKIAEILLKLNKKDAAVAKYKESAEKYRERGFLVQAIAIYKVILGIEPKNTEIQDLVARLMEEKTGVAIGKKGVLSATVERSKEPAPKPAPLPEESPPPKEEAVPLPDGGGGTIELGPEPAAEIEIPRESEEGKISAGETADSVEPGMIALEGEGEAETSSLELDTATPFEKGEVPVQDLTEAEPVPPESGGPIELGPPDQPLGEVRPEEGAAGFDPMDFLDTRPAGGEEKEAPEPGTVNLEWTAESGLELGDGNPPVETGAGEIDLGQPTSADSSSVGEEVQIEAEDSGMEVEVEMLEEAEPAEPSDVVPVEQEEEMPDSGPEHTPLFSDLTADEFERVFELLTSMVVEPGTVIVKEGEAGDSIFIVARGEVRVTRQKEGIEEREVALLGPGSFFGEMGYFHGDRRATVTAVKKCLLLEMSKPNLDQVVSEFPRVKEVLLKFYRERVLMNVLADSPLFRELSREELQYFAERFEFKEYRPGEVVVNEGEPGDSMFLIKSGTVKVETVHPVKEEKVELARLSAGDFFGEVSLIKNKPRTATIVVVEPAELLELRRTAFEDIARKHSEIASSLEQTIEHRVEETIRKMIADLKK